MADSTVGNWPSVRIASWLPPAARLATRSTTCVCFAAATNCNPTVTDLGSPTIEAGSQATIGGVLTAGSVVPAGTVTISIGGATATAVLDSFGHFSATVATEALRAASSPYAVAFSYAGDGNFAAATGASTVRVVDTVPPTIGDMTAIPNLIAVPNHKMFGVVVAYTAADVSGPPVCSLTATSNEPSNGLGDGNTSIDAVIIDAHDVQLRAERSGTGGGRIYTITATCGDAFGNASSKAVTVSIPK